MDGAQGLHNACHGKPRSTSIVHKTNFFMLPLLLNMRMESLEGDNEQRLDAMESGNPDGFRESAHFTTT